MKISQHLAVGAISAVPVYLATKSIETTSAFFISNSLIDVDHFFDYWLDHGFNLNWNKFYKSCQAADFVHYIVFLHSFEIIIAFFIAWLISKNPIILGITLGFSCHILSDIIHNKGIRPQYLSFLMRMTKKFKIDEIGDTGLLSERRKAI